MHFEVLGLKLFDGRSQKIRAIFALLPIDVKLGSIRDYRISNH